MIDEEGEELVFNPEQPRKDERFKHVASSYPGLIVGEDMDPFSPTVGEKTSLEMKKRLSELCPKEQMSMNIAEESFC
jgi:hypothetical protein